MGDLSFAMEILSNEKNCESCFHARSGHCALYSCTCANDVAHHAANPSRWMSYEEGEELLPEAEAYIEGRQKVEANSARMGRGNKTKLGDGIPAWLQGRTT